MSETERAIVKGKFSLNSDLDGSRKSLGNSAYRPNHQFEGFPSTFIGFVEFEGGECAPGETKDAIIDIVYTKEMKHLLKVGNEWIVKEWPKEVGKLEISEVQFGS